MQQAASAAATMGGPLGSHGGRARTARRSSNLGDRIFEGIVTAAGLLVLGLLGGIIVLLFIGGWPAFREFGFGFLWSAEWDSVREQFGAVISVYGTIVTSILAIVFAVPVAFGIAYYLTEIAPEVIRRPVGIAIELLAAVPSIIYGMWGLFVLAPFLAQYVQPPIQDWTMDIPILNELFGGPAFGIGIFTAALILAIMILPFIAATMRDVFMQVPAIYKESAYGLGATRWEVVRNVVFPYTRASVVGGIMLGLGRALGETMAVTFVIGNANAISPSLFATGNTIASVIALEFPEALQGSLKLSSLLALGFILFVISFIVLATSRYMLRPRLGN
ncbi:phosphate ABC transporter permease subunit PstC [Elioraea rosea]|uniref:phosphate ABC transporter permease subunit PstC n=1 Tax=Elioraea rosea TaxID=2492390 RepID=UPI0011837B92|nr:phosphate ABC transporter permease subunit PstC [Elioraea rosea]